MATPEKKVNVFTVFAGLFTFLKVLLLVSPLLIIEALGAYKTFMPRDYEKSLDSYLGIGLRTTTTIDVEAFKKIPELMKIVEEEKINLDDLAYVVSGLQALDAFVPADKPRPSIGIALPLVIRRHESGNGANMGNQSSKQRACAPENTSRLDRWDVEHGKRYKSYDFCAAQTAAINKLLEQMEKYHVADTDPVAASYIVKDATGKYVDFIGHPVAEIGPDGFLPSTAWSVCEEYLSKSSDEEIASCDFWSNKVTTAAKIYYMYDFGYSETLSEADQIKEMHGWNTNVEYVTGMVQEANALRAKLAAVDLGGIKLVSSKVPVFKGSSKDSNVFRIIALGMLKSVGLLPKGVAFSASGYLGSQEWLALPVSKNGGISQEYSAADGGHKGVDFGCLAGTDVLAPASGVVSDPTDDRFKIDSLTKEGGVWNWGIVLFVHHGDRLSTAYFHLAEVYVQYGQWVEKGTPLGRCGHTGWSYSYDKNGNAVYNTDASNHLHFEVECTVKPEPIRGPADWVGIQRLNPHGFLGKTIDPENCGSVATSPIATPEHTKDD